MAHRTQPLLLLGTWGSLWAVAACGQARPSNVSRVDSTPPAAMTRLEAFKPRAGTLITFGYDELGSVEGVSVDARELKGGDGAPVRGLVVDVRESEYRQERAFVDADEIPELIHGLDALIDVKANPTTFTNFEIQYETRGDLQLTAFNNSRGQISFSVRAGRGVTASQYLDINRIRRFRELLVAAGQRLNPLARP